MINEFRFEFSELQVQASDISNLIGYENQVVPEPFPELIDKALNWAKTLPGIRAGYKVFDEVSIDAEKQTIQIYNQLFHPGKIVCKQLSGSQKIAVFLSSAGDEIVQHSKSISLEIDPVAGYVYDVLGSVIVEKATDRVQQFLTETYQKKDLSLSDRFSPGYCDWFVAEQKQLFALLPHNFCKILLSDSFLMNPIKSVSGFIGIGHHLKQSGYQCNWCNDLTCIYGNIKRRKNK